MPTLKLNDNFVATLMEARKAHRYPVHLRASAREFAQNALALLFPHFSQDERAGQARPELIQAEAILLGHSLQELLRTVEDCSRRHPADAAVPQKFLDGLPEVYSLLRSDADAIFHGDPAADSMDEVILSYPGFYAIAVYRIAHLLYRLGVPILPRVLTEYAHEQTGVDIHPGATIGRNFFIDHGTGVVIGETTVIGNGVKLYQGVTLGALVVEKALSKKKRHPTLEDNVVVYSNATILGGNTVIGHDSVIGGNAWLTASVPPFSQVSRETDVRSRKFTKPEEMDFNI